MMYGITALFADVYNKTYSTDTLIRTAILVVVAAIVRGICTIVSLRMSFLASKTVKKTLREKIYEKLLSLGSAYRENVQTSEVVQVAVEGCEQLETYFCAYLPQFFYAMLAPLTLFVVLLFVNVPSAIVLLVCVPLIPVSIAVVQTWAKKLLSKYWGRYTAFGVIMAATQLRAGHVSVAGALLIILLSADFFIPMRQLGSFFHIAMNGMAASDKIFRLLDIYKPSELPF